MSEAKTNKADALQVVRDTLAMFDKSDFGRVLRSITELREMFEAVQDAALRERRFKGTLPRVPIGFNAFVNAGAHAHVATRPQLLVRPRWLVIAPESAPYFDIRDFRVGKDSQYATCDAVAGSIFSAEHVKNHSLSELLRWDGEICEPGVELSLGVVNNDQACMRQFRAVLVCDLLDN